MSTFNKGTIEGAEVMYDNCGSLSLRFIVLYDENTYNIKKSLTFWWNLENGKERRWAHQLLDALETNGRVSNLNGKKLRVLFEGSTAKDLFYLNKDVSIIQ